MARMWVGAVVAAGFAAAPLGVLAADYPVPLAVESSGTSSHLPSPYPDRWVFLDYVASPSLIDSKVELVDPAARFAKQVVAQVGANYYANFLQSSARPEVYVAETFFSRGVRGARTDVITVYDKETLTAEAEIVLPGARRWVGVLQPNAFQFADHEKLGLVYNFTPASSVTVVNLETRQVLGQVPLPGCALIYPSGQRGFASLCNDGTLLSVQLDKDGGVASQIGTPAFNDLADDPLFAAPAVIGGVSYFVSFKGRVQPVDLSGGAPKLLPTWSLISEEDAKSNWRPSGNQLVAGGADGRLYVIMQPNGKEGSHLEGGSQVWVFDVATHAKLAVVKLRASSQCIAVGGGDSRKLYATTESASLDTYDVSTGALVSTIMIPSDGAETLIYPVRP